MALREYNQLKHSHGKWMRSRMSQSISISPIQMFYWKVNFIDGFELSQFDEQGHELLLKDILSDEHWGLKDGVRTLKKSSNLFSNVEKQHGRAVKVGWYPFDKLFADKILTKDPRFAISLVQIKEPHTMAIPENGYAFIAKELEFNWSRTTPVLDENNQPVFENGKQKLIHHEPAANQSDLYFGYLMRDGSAQSDIKHVRLNVVEES